MNEGCKGDVGIWKNLEEIVRMLTESCKKFERKKNYQNKERRL